MRILSFTICFLEFIPSRWRTGYSTTSVTVPAPTVRPPSRIAKRTPFVHGDRRDQLHRQRLTLSPGITISVPSGNVATARHVRRPEVKLRPVAH